MTLKCMKMKVAVSAVLVIYGLIATMTVVSAFASGWIVSYDGRKIFLHVRGDESRGIQYIRVETQDMHQVFGGDYSEPGPHDVTFSINNIYPGDFPLHFYVMEFGGVYTKFDIQCKVGGIVVPVDKLDLLTPSVGFSSTILVATAATAIFVKHVKRKKENQ